MSPAMRSRVVRITAALAFCQVPSAALAQPVGDDDVVYNPDNGHYYMAVEAPAGILWTDARAAAEAFSYMGAPGHLATLTSADENQFIVDHLTQAAIDLYWLGGYQLENEPDPLANWFWVTGEAWDYTNWADFEPNDGDGAGAERVLSLWRSDWGDPVPAPDTVLGVWNDEPDWYPGPGFVVEFSIQQCSPADLAEPFGSLTVADFVAFLYAYAHHQDEADLARPYGRWNLWDIIAFLRAFAQGCP